MDNYKIISIGRQLSVFICICCFPQLAWGQFALNLGNLYPGDTLHIRYAVGVQSFPSSLDRIGNQMKLTGSNFSTVFSDDPDVGGANDTTFTMAFSPVGDLAVFGQGLEIPDGDTNPSSSDGTDFGTVRINGSRTDSFYIKNVGFDTLRLDSIVLCGINGSGNGFSFDTPGFNFGVNPQDTLMEGDSVLLRIHFNPTQLCGDSALIKIYSSDSDESVYDFVVRGEAFDNKVTNTNDSGCGSLRYAITTAEPGDTICFDPAIDGQVIVLSSGFLGIDKNLVILGNDSSKTIIDGNAASRVFFINGHTVTLENMTIRNGRMLGAGLFQNNGGGVLNYSGYLTLKNIAVVGNRSEEGAAIANNLGTLEISASRINENVADSLGGAIHNTGILNIESSFIQGNSAKTGAGIYNKDTLHLRNSVLSGNLASSGGGGIWTDKASHIISSTIAGNEAVNDGGGICITAPAATLDLDNSIVAENASANGPDIQVDGGSTINSDHSFIRDPNGGHNVINGVNGNIVGFSPGFIKEVYPLTLPNTTGDLRLKCFSFALNAGKDTTGLGLGPVDLAGKPRIIGPMIDMGAYERHVDVGKYIVTTTDDYGPGSLRELITVACDGDTICFDMAINGDTIKLSREIAIDSDIHILGNDTSNTIIDGNGNGRIFIILNMHSVFMDGLRLQNGNGFSNEYISGQGGAITNLGKLYFSNGVIRNSSALLGGAVFNVSTTIAHFTNSVITSNSSNFGGAFYNLAAELQFTNSVISFSHSNFTGGGIYQNAAGLLKVINSKLLANSSEFGGGALYTELANSLFINAQVSGNESKNSNAGGIWIESGMAEFRNSTIAGNKSVLQGAGVFVNTGANAKFTNTIIARNISTASLIQDVFGGAGIMDGGNNLVGNGSGQTILVDGVNGNQVGSFPLPVDPQFVQNVPSAPSAGGNLFVLCTSPALDAGKDTSGLGLGPLDLGGMPRIIGAAIDIGAFETSCQEIDVVYKNGNSIAAGDSIPGLLDGTDFGEVCPMFMDSFYVKNVKEGELILDTIRLEQYGANPSKFNYNEGDFNFPVSISGGDSVLIKITFDPMLAGPDSALIVIENNDGDEDPYNFVIAASRAIASYPVPYITGPVTVCSDLINIPYSVPLNPSVYSYNWMYSGTGVTIQNNGSADILLNFSSTATSGTLTIQLLTVCGEIGATSNINVNIGSSEFCALANCTRENLFVDDELLALTGAPGVYKVSNTLQSDILLMVDKFLSFKAGNAIELYPPFTVESGAVFLAEIEQCNLVLKEEERK